MSKLRYGPACLATALALAAFASRSAADAPFERGHAAFGEIPIDLDVAGPARAKLRVPAEPPAPAPPKRAVGANGCSDDMVRVAGRFCIDRYEASTVDARSGRPLSPYFPPTVRAFFSVLEQWVEAEVAPSPSLLPLPFPDPAWQRAEGFAPRAVVRQGVTPQGYASRNAADAACRNAGKRLCSEDEWVTACKGERATKFPYGDAYRHGVCNVFRDDHPAHLLHGSFSEGLLDPRLNQVKLGDEPLLRATGATPACKSVWGKDAVYDMVGNLDEWVDDPDGTFVGGFYARPTRQGCEAKVTTHPAVYFDYSLGVRCCDRLR